ncbi:MAG: fumarylacetoacetate hydrolase family protein [Bacillota bacterium]
MSLARYVRFVPRSGRAEAGGEPPAGWGLWESDRVQALASSPFAPSADGKDRAEPAVVGPSYPLDQVRLLVPCLPSKVVGVGFNYRRHAQELDVKLPERPVLFLKPLTAVVGPGDPVVCPDMSRQVEYEGELAVVIGRAARAVSPAEAREYIFGYTCANDMTARDLQAKDGQWTVAKGFDTFCPLGPAVVTGLDPTTLTVTTTVNGEVRQHGAVSDLIFGISELVSYISRVMTLLPGDVILTGTPAGVGPVRPGDRMRVAIAGIGELENPVAAPR